MQRVENEKRGGEGHQASGPTLYNGSGFRSTTKWMLAEDGNAVGGMVHDGKVRESYVVAQSLTTCDASPPPQRANGDGDLRSKSVRRHVTIQRLSALHLPNWWFLHGSGGEDVV